MAQKLENLLDIINSGSFDNPPAGLGGMLGGFNFLGGLPPVNIPLRDTGPTLGPDDFGSYTIPMSDPTYRSGFDYARSIAGGIPMSQVIAPGVSYSPEQPGGYTQADLNAPVVTPPVETPPVQEPDIQDFLGTGIGGVRIPVDRTKLPPLRDIFGGFQKPDLRPDIQPITPPIQTPPAIDIDAIRQQIAESGIDFGNLLGIPKIEQPDLSQFVRREDIPTLIPDVPTGRDFSVDREQLIEDIRSGIDLPVYEAPDLSQFVRREDIPSLIPSVPTGGDFSIDREELIKDIREGIEIPKYEMPDLSQFARLEDIPTVPTFDREALIRDIRSGIDIPQPPSIDREALIRDITGRIDIPKPPSIDRQALIEDIRSGIELPTYQAPDLSGFARLEDIPKIPSREDFLSIAREGIEIPQYQAPDLSGFARLEDIPTFDPNVLKQDILMSIPQQQVPDVSQFVTQEDIQQAISGIDIPTYQAPDLSGFARLEDIPTFDPSGLQQQISGLQQQVGSITPFDASALQQQIAANQAAIAGINIPTYQVPDVSQFVTQEDIQQAIAGIPTPTTPDISGLITQEQLQSALAGIPQPETQDLSGLLSRISELESSLAALQQPTGSTFSISQEEPIGLF